MNSVTTPSLMIELSPDAALVFSDWLHRFNKSPSGAFMDPSEQKVLWDIECILESAIEDLLSPNYEKKLVAARARIRDGE